MDWGTRQHAADRQQAKRQLTALETAFPKVDSAYVPSGKVPAKGLAALALGSGLGVPIGGLVAVILGGITVGLLVLVGLLIALIAACGWVVCITSPSRSASR